MSPNGNIRVNSRAWRGSGQRCSAAFRPIAGFGDPQEAATLNFVYGSAGAIQLPVTIEMPTDTIGIVQLQLQRYTVTP